MKSQIFLTVVFIFIFFTNAKLTDDNGLCKSIQNPYSPSNEQPDLLKTEKFQNDMLNAHNILRKKHCVPALILDKKISENAQAYAEYLAKQDSRLIHSDRKNLLGENLYSTTASNPIINPDANRVTRSWYDEIVNYNFDVPGSITNTGHFTQMVWKDTKKLGIGIAFGRQGRKMYVVAQYDPPGNHRHAFNTNVFPAKC